MINQSHSIPATQACALNMIYLCQYIEASCISRRSSLLHEQHSINLRFKTHYRLSNNESITRVNRLAYLHVCFLKQFKYELQAKRQKFSKICIFDILYPLAGPLIQHKNVRVLPEENSKVIEVVHYEDFARKTYGWLVQKSDTLLQDMCPL